MRCYYLLYKFITYASALLWWELSNKPIITYQAKIGIWRHRKLDYCKKTQIVTFLLQSNPLFEFPVMDIWFTLQVNYAKDLLKG